MLKAEQVPKEAIEAAAVMLSNGKTTAQAIAAALNAWPNRKDEWRDNITFDGKPIRYSVIILHLTQETRHE